MMKSVQQRLVLTVGLLLTIGTGRALALPGQLTEDVAAWIQGHPTLRPQLGERLLVRKSDTAAQRFVFQASVLPPGRATFIRDKGIIRSERFSIFDMVNGVSQERLTESLRAIYGLDIYQDYARARVIYAYPGPMPASQVRQPVSPLQTALQGDLRVGDRFAYWTEIANNPRNRAYTGQLVVFLREDLDKLEAELRNR